MSKPSSSVTRRAFVRNATRGATLATGVLAGLPVTARAEAEGHAIRTPADFAAAKSAPLPTIDFPLTGADAFARVCKAEGLAALFCCPGNYEIIHAITNQGIPAFSGRTEGAMCSAADAFIRCTGELAAASGTEGPGFTNMIVAVAAANAARTPLLVLASNMSLYHEDREFGIQLGYQQPTTEGLKKYGKRLVNPSRVHEYAGYAFRQLRHGMPRPVHLDFPSEVCLAKFKTPAELDHYVDATRYRTSATPHPSPAAIARAAALLDRAERPMIVSSTGVFYARAWDALQALAVRAQIPVVESGPVRGQFSDAHPLSASTAPNALPSADVVVLVGQYCMPTPGEFAFGPDTQYIRIDPCGEDIGRNLPIDVGIVSDERAALEALEAAVAPKKRPAWIAEIASARDAFERENAELYRVGAGYDDAVHPAVIAKELADFLYRKGLPADRTTVASGGFGIARYTRRFLRALRPGQIMNGAYQYGAIGPDVAYAVGVGAAVQLGAGVQAGYKGHPIVCVTGDAGFGYTGMEIETLAKYRIPAIVIVYNNNAWGTWPGARESAVLRPLHLFQENLRYDKVGEALGAHGEYVTTPKEFTPALERAYRVALEEQRPSVINCQAKKEFWVREQFPPGMLGKVEPGCMAYYH
ncbi:MAG: thiamine pyrophosphate-binding protein [Vicinamibacterales bacterium]